MTNRAASALRATALAGAALLFSGCGVFSPIQTTYDYEPADGVSLSIRGLDLRNLVVVVPAEGGTGIVVGQAVNPAGTAVEVTFAVDGAPAPATASVPAVSGTSLPGAAGGVEIPGIPAPPGSTVRLTVTTDEAGANVVQVPVLPDIGHHSDLTASS